MSYKDMILVVLPVVIGSLITIIPNVINKKIESNTKVLEENRNIKLGNYVELINLIIVVLKNQGIESYYEALISKINIVNMIGSAEVVVALNHYIESWGIETKEEQNNRYFKLLVAMRKDIGIDSGDLSRYPTIGLLDINKV